MDKNQKNDDPAANTNEDSTIQPAPETNDKATAKEGGKKKPPAPPAVVAPRQYRAVRDSFANGRYYEKDKIYAFGAGDPVSEHFEAVQ